jgi:hypothetical protein
MKNRGQKMSMRIINCLDEADGGYGNLKKALRTETPRSRAPKPRSHTSETKKQVEKLELDGAYGSHVLVGIEEFFIPLIERLAEVPIGPDIGRLFDIFRPLEWGARCMPEHAASLDKLLKGYVKEPEPYGPPDQLTWFLKSQINATKIAILTELNVKIAKKNPVKRELVELLRKQFLAIEGLGIDDAIKRCSQLCTSKNIIFIPFVAASDDQLNPMSGVTQDTLLFSSAPQRQDAIEMLSNCEWDSERSEELGLTKPADP